MVGNPTTWLVDIGGGKTSGPYSTEQIQEFVKSGKLQAQHRLTSAEPGGQWITVSEFLAKPHALQSNVPFQPPPKPNLLDQRDPAAPQTRHEDPTLGLFDALQAAKDRKAVHKPIYSPAQEQGGFFSGVPSAVWMTALGLVVFGMMGWGLIQTFKQQGEKLAQVETPATKSASQAAAKTAPPAAPKVTAPAQPVAQAPSPPKPATVPAFRPSSLSHRPSMAISPFGRGPSAQPLAAPIVRSPASEDRDLASRERERDDRDRDREREEADSHEAEKTREKEEADREREHAKAAASAGRDPDSESAISGTVAPAPDSGTPPPPPPGAGAEEPKDTDSGRID
jgi:hypothetical protein